VVRVEDLGLFLPEGARLEQPREELPEAGFLRANGESGGPDTARTLKRPRARSDLLDETLRLDNTSFMQAVQEITDPDLLAPVTHLGVKGGGACTRRDPVTGEETVTTLLLYVEEEAAKGPRLVELIKAAKAEWPELTIHVLNDCRAFLWSSNIRQRFPWVDLAKRFGVEPGVVAGL
jgi:hypothetical protein